MTVTVTIPADLRDRLRREAIEVYGGHAREAHAESDKSAEPSFDGAAVLALHRKMSELAAVLDQIEWTAGKPAPVDITVDAGLLDTLLEEVSDRLHYSIDDMGHCGGRTFTGDEFREFGRVMDMVADARQAVAT